jgi:hypothetical protein
MPVYFQNNSVQKSKKPLRFLQKMCNLDCFMMKMDTKMCNFILFSSPGKEGSYHENPWELISTVLPRFPCRNELFFVKVAESSEK